MSRSGISSPDEFLVHIPSEAKPASPEHGDCGCGLEAALQLILRMKVLGLENLGTKKS